MNFTYEIGNIEKVLPFSVRYHYYARFEGTKILEMWMLKADRVLKLLIPKLKRNFNNVKNLKDPRLVATISKTDIVKYGKRIKMVNGGYVT